MTAYDAPSSPTNAPAEPHALQAEAAKLLSSPKESTPKSQSSGSVLGNIAHEVMYFGEGLISGAVRGPAELLDHVFHTNVRANLTFSNQADVDNSWAGKIGETAGPALNPGTTILNSHEGMFLCEGFVSGGGLNAVNGVSQLSNYMFGTDIGAVHLDNQEAVDDSLIGKVGETAGTAADVILISALTGGVADAVGVTGYAGVAGSMGIAGIVQGGVFTPTDVDKPMQQRLINASIGGLSGLGGVGAGAVINATAETVTGVVGQTAIKAVGNILAGAGTAALATEGTSYAGTGQAANSSDLLFAFAVGGVGGAMTVAHPGSLNQPADIRTIKPVPTNPDVVIGEPSVVPNKTTPVETAQRGSEAKTENVENQIKGMQIRSLKSTGRTDAQGRPIYGVVDGVSLKTARSDATILAAESNQPVVLEHSATYNTKSESTVQETFIPGGSAHVSHLKLLDGREINRTGTSGTFGKYMVTRKSDGYKSPLFADIQSNNDGQIEFYTPFAKVPTMSTEVKVETIDGRVLVNSNGTLPRQTYDGSNPSRVDNVIDSLKGLGLGNTKNAAIFSDSYAVLEKTDAGQHGHAIDQYTVKLTPEQTATLDAELKNNPSLKLIPADQFKEPEQFLASMPFLENPKGRYGPYFTVPMDRTTTLNYLWKDENGQLMTMMASRKGPPYQSMEGAPGGFVGINVEEGSIEGAKQSGTREAKEEHGVPESLLTLKPVVSARVANDIRAHVEDTYFVAELGNISRSDLADMRAKDILKARDDAAELFPTPVKDILAHPENYAFDHPSRLFTAMDRYHPELLNEWFGDKLPEIKARNEAAGQMGEQQRPSLVQIMADRVADATDDTAPYAADYLTLRPETAKELMKTGDLKAIEKAGRLIADLRGLTTTDDINTRLRTVAEVAPDYFERTGNPLDIKINLDTPVIDQQGRAVQSTDERGNLIYKDQTGKEIVIDNDGNKTYFPSGEKADVDPHDLRPVPKPMSEVVVDALASKMPENLHTLEKAAVGISPEPARGIGVGPTDVFKSASAWPKDARISTAESYLSFLDDVTLANGNVIPAGSQLSNGTIYDPNSNTLRSADGATALYVRTPATEGNPSKILKVAEPGEVAKISSQAELTAKDGKQAGTLLTDPGAGDKDIAVYGGNASDPMAILNSYAQKRGQFDSRQSVLGLDTQGRRIIVPAWAQETQLDLPEYLNIDAIKGGNQMFAQGGKQGDGTRHMLMRRIGYGNREDLSTYNGVPYDKEGNFSAASAKLVVSVQGWDNQAGQALKSYDFVDLLWSDPSLHGALAPGSAAESADVVSVPELPPGTMQLVLRNKNPDKALVVKSGDLIFKRADGSYGKIESQ